MRYLGLPIQDSHEASSVIDLFNTGMLLGSLEMFGVFAPTDTKFKGRFNCIPAAWSCITDLWVWHIASHFTFSGHYGESGTSTLPKMSFSLVKCTYTC